MRVAKALFCAAALLALLVPGVRADDYNKLTYFTFSAPVQVPGVTLPAGKYMFKLADPESGRRVIQIWDEEGKKLLTTLLTMTEQRSDVPKDPMVMFKEQPAGEAAAVRSWYYEGERTGYEFIYPKDQAMKIARASHERVLATDESGPDLAKLNAANVIRIDEGGASADSGTTASTTSTSTASTTTSTASSTTSRSSSTATDSTNAAAPQTSTTTASASTNSTTTAPSTTTASASTNSTTTAPSTTTASASTDSTSAAATQTATTTAPAQAATTTAPAPQPSATRTESAAPVTRTTDAVSSPEPVGTAGSAGQTPVAAVAQNNARLPRTNSALPLFGLLSGVCLATALGVRQLRKRIA